MTHTHALFGTDGIRGTPGKHPLTEEMIGKIGTAAAVLIRRSCRGKVVPKVIIGRDTRLTGSDMEALLARAFAAQGVEVGLAGIITTPGVSFLVRGMKARMGIAISASHNKASDNGIKFFDAQGYKLGPEQESAIEELVRSGEGVCSCGKKPAKIQVVRGAQKRYFNFLLSTVKGLNLKGLHVALDLAYGAAAPIGEKVFKKLGAQVTVIHDKAAGESINEGGSTKPEFIRALVLQSKADMGVALDGDGDRAVVVDNTGHVADGDIIIGMAALHCLKKKTLPKKGVVLTVMSNVGLKNTLKAAGVTMAVTDVGDKHVLDALIQHGYAIGGEQSGHIIFMKYLPAPDGLLTALQVIKVIKESGRPLSALSRQIPKYPQVLVNVRVSEKKPFEKMHAVWHLYEKSVAQLGEQGRILLRYSGTEQLARVMAEGPDKAEIEIITEKIARAIQDEIGLK